MKNITSSLYNVNNKLESNLGLSSGLPIRIHNKIFNTLAAKIILSQRNLPTIASIKIK